MRLIPLIDAWNLLTQGSDAGDDREWLRSAPVGNLTTADFREPAISNGVWVVQAGVNDDIDINEGAGELTATLTAATYYSAHQFAEEVEAQLEVAGTHSYTVTWLQDDAARYRFKIADDTGTVALPWNSGTNAATSARGLLGYGDYDRSAAATHTGDVAVIHDPILGARVQRSSIAGIARCAVVVGPVGGCDLRANARFSGASPERYGLGDYDDELMVTFFDAVDNATVSLELLCPHSADTQLVGAGYGYIGDYYEPSNAWEVSSYDLDPIDASVIHRTQSGRAYVGAEFGQRYSLKLGWRGAPGYDPDDLPQLRHLLDDIGIGDPLVVAMDPANEPTRESYLCRLVAMPSLTKVYTEGKPGRWAVSLELETVSVR